MDGVFSEAHSGRLILDPAPPPSDEEVAQVLATVRVRVGRLPPAASSNLDHLDPGIIVSEQPELALPSR